MPLEARDIELLHLLFTTGSVSGAARRLHMSQPNASKILKRIEDQVGFAVFDRLGGRLLPTRDGRALIEQAERTLHSVRQLDRLARDIRDMRGERLVIGSLPLLARRWVPEVLGAFLERNPMVCASFHTRSSQKLIEWVGEGQIDLAIALLTLDDPMVERSILTPVEVVVAMPAGHPLCQRQRIRPRDLDGVSYVSLGVSDHAREALDRLFREERAVPNERAECALPAAAIQLVERGVGVSLIDHITASEYEGRAVVFRRFRPHTTLDVWLLRPRLRPRSRLTEEFVTMLRASLDDRKLSTPAAQLFAR